MSRSSTIVPPCTRTAADGRVVLDDAGRYRLVADAFDRHVLAALRRLVL
jgi:hypothetical protein